MSKIKSTSNSPSTFASMVYRKCRGSSGFVAKRSRGAGASLSVLSDCKWPERSDSKDDYDANNNDSIGHSNWQYGVRHSNDDWQ